MQLYSIDSVALIIEDTLENQLLDYITVNSLLVVYYRFIMNYLIFMLIIDLRN